MKVLNETATRLAPKQQIYAQKLQQGESLLRDFQGMEKYVVSDATNKLMEEQHGQCEKC